VVGAYLCPEDRSAALQDLHEAALCAADAPSSDAGRHLAGVRAAIDASPDVDRLREFQSEGHVEGVPLDADLRWRIWLRLAALGGCDRAEIDAAEHEDETAEGVENAARCRAALPDPDAKQAAWTLLTTPGAASSAVLYETARGFWQPTQLELTSEYAARWFDDLPATARFRSGSALARVAWLSFPWVAVDAETVARAEAVAGRDDVAPGVRRAAMDGGDDVRRALASRARFCR
jgi:aminopeptidase N